MNGKGVYVGENGFSILRWTFETTEHSVYGGGCCNLKITFSYNKKTTSTSFEEDSFIEALKKSFLGCIDELFPDLNGSVSKVKFNIELKVESGCFVAVVVSGNEKFEEFTDGNPNKAIVLSIFNFYDCLIQEALRRKEV